MDLVQVGIDHQLAPIDVRERLALDGPGAAQVARDLLACAWADEVLVLSTCNRTEVYVVSPAPNAQDLALSALLDHLPHAPDPEHGSYRQQSGEGAALHLLRVACGLESAILGETEIQGQVKDALAHSREAGSTGTVLGRLGEAALRVGKRARSETGIGKGGVSHGSAAVDVVSRIFDSLAGRRVLVVGAGTIATQAARAFAAFDGVEFVVANRTRENAETLAAELPRSAVIDLDSLPKQLEEAHVVVLATGTEPMPAAAVERALARRRDPLLLVDMGLPRCVDPEAATLPGVFLYDLEDLEQLVAGALAVRRAAVPDVESLIHEELDRFRAWYRTLAALPTIRTLNAWAERVREEEVGYIDDELPPDLRGRVERMTKRLVRRLLGRPTERVVKGVEGEDPNLPTAEHLRQVFGLEEESASRDKGTE